MLFFSFKSTTGFAKKNSTIGDLENMIDGFSGVYCYSGLRNSSLLFFFETY